MLQHYGDTLWQTLGKQAAPNDGFQQGFVVPTSLLAEAAAAAAAEGDSPAAAAAAAAAAGTDVVTAVAAERMEQLALNGDSSSNGQPPQPPAAATGSSSSSSSSSDMNQLLEVSLLQALLKSVKDADLPLNSTTLWGQHIKPCRPGGSELDVKRSSHKKMSKFLQVCAGVCGVLFGKGCDGIWGLSIQYKVLAVC